MAQRTAPIVEMANLSVWRDDEHCRQYVGRVQRVATCTLLIIPNPLLHQPGVSHEHDLWQIGRWVRPIDRSLRAHCRKHELLSSSVLGADPQTPATVCAGRYWHTANRGLCEPCRP